MFQLVFVLTMVFVVALITSNLWIHVIHPFLFGESIEDKLDNAVEQKVMNEADKKAAEILEEGDTNVGT